MTSMLRPPEDPKTLTSLLHIPPMLKELMIKLLLALSEGKLCEHSGHHVTMGATDAPPVAT